MRARPFDPRHLDVEAFADRTGALEGHLPLGTLPRLVEATDPEARPAVADTVAWRAHGERRVRRGSPPQAWLQLSGECTVQLTCQRCLQAVEVPLAIDRSYRFVADEAAAANADIDAEEDVLATIRSLDLAALIEDELLLALPLVPRHDGVCPRPLEVPMDTAAPGSEDTRSARPFEALAALKQRRSVN